MNWLVAETQSDAERIADAFGLDWRRKPGRVPKWRVSGVGSAVVGHIYDKVVVVRNDTLETAPGWKWFGMCVRTKIARDDAVEFIGR